MSDDQVSISLYAFEEIMDLAYIGYGGRDQWSEEQKQVSLEAIKEGDLAIEQHNDKD